MKEYRDYETTISRVADLGTAYENMSRPAGDTSRKPSIVSPSKRSSITTRKYFSYIFFSKTYRFRSASQCYVETLDDRKRKV